MQIVVGKITEEEKVNIRSLNNHKVGLEELLLILPSDSTLYSVAKEDLEATVQKYREWWKVHSEKYKWERGQGEWIVLFRTNEIVIEN